MDIFLTVGEYDHLSTSKKLTVLLLILDMLYHLPGNNGIYNETGFFESVYFILFLGIRHKFYISTLYSYSHCSSFNYRVNATDYNSKCTKM